MTKLRQGLEVVARILYGESLELRRKTTINHLKKQLLPVIIPIRYGQSPAWALGAGPLILETSVIGTLTLLKTLEISASTADGSDLKELVKLLFGIKGVDFK